MLTLKAILRATRQMAAYGELGVPVPRDRGPSPHADGPLAGLAPDAATPPSPGGGAYRKWDEEMGTYLLVGDEAPASEPAR